jgi:hypothetical protein
MSYRTPGGWQDSSIHDLTGIPVVTEDGIEKAANALAALPIGARYLPIGAR